MSARAVFERKCAPLDSDFGKAMAAKWFTPEQLATVAGKAWVVWDKCTRGGWVSEGTYMGDSPIGHVARPGTHNVRIEKSRVPVLHSRGRVAGTL